MGLGGLESMRGQQAFAAAAFRPGQPLLAAAPCFWPACKRAFLCACPTVDGLFLSVDLKYPATPKDYQLQNEVSYLGSRCLAAAPQFCTAAAAHHPVHGMPLESPPQTMMEGIRFKTDWKQDDMVQLHLDNMRQQLAQLKTALQLAVALNRTIIMPKARRPCCLQAKAPFAMLGRRHQQEACAAFCRACWS